MKPSNPSLVSYAIDDGVAVITLDDGGNNLISPAMIHQLNAALDRAEKENYAVVLTGARHVFSAGFDLKVLRTGVLNAFSMLVGGFKLSRRLLAFPRPIVIACNGHAIAMGVFLLLSGDYRICVRGDFKIVANEVENGLTMPYSALAVCRYRLRHSAYDRIVNLSETFSPETAIDTGLIDELVEPEQLLSLAKSRANTYAALNEQAHRHTKLRMRRQVLRKMTIAIWADRIDFIRVGIARALHR